jgi:CRP-like cAMP-binding protein
VSQRPGLTRAVRRDERRFPAKSTSNDVSAAEVRYYHDDVPRTAHMSWSRQAVYDFDPLLLFFRARDDLTEFDLAALRGLFTRSETFARKAELIVEDAQPTTSMLLVKGFVARYRYGDKGERQLSAIHVPGDFIDLHGFLLRRMDHGIVALTGCKILRAPHARLAVLSAEQPHLTRLLWMCTVIDAAIHRAWIVAGSRSTAVAHIAHFLCELNYRLGIVGLSDGRRFSLPITQQDCADLLGRSLVHVNRGLRQLKALGFLDWSGGVVTLLKPQVLVDMAEFDPTYLSAWKEAR